MDPSQNDKIYGICSGSNEPQYQQMMKNYLVGIIINYWYYITHTFKQNKQINLCNMNNDKINNTPSHTLTTPTPTPSHKN